MSGRGCDMFCFGDCQNKYEKYVVRKESEGLEKVSLKKFGSNSQHFKGLNKIKSVSRLQNPKSFTDRSNQSLKDELSMMRKRSQIQKQLQTMNQSISEISNQYRSKLQMLEQIRREMDTVLKKGRR